MKKMGTATLVVLLVSCSNEPEINNADQGTPDAGADVVQMDQEDMPGADAQTGLTFNGDILPMVHEHCLPCHAAGDIGPYDLTDYDTVVDIASLIESSIQSRVMPPWGVDNSGDCNTYKDARWMSDEEIATFSEWLGGDQALGNPDLAPEPPGPASPLPRVDVTLDPGVEYTPTDTPDDYRCFVVDPGLTEDQFITGFHVRPGNVETVHHVVVWDMVSDENVTTAEELDAADPGPGYECFGGPGTAGFNLYAAWAPGTPPTVFPEPTGLPLPAGRKIVVQVHYNTLENNGPDRTVVDLMLAPSVGSQTLQVIFANIEMALPGGEVDAEAVFDIQPSQLGAPLAVAVHGVFPHMHGKGKSMTVTHITEDGATCAVDVPRWDFNWQQMYFFEQPLLLEPDDLLRLSCRYDLSAETGTVPWGEGTDDEMCVAIFYATVGTWPGAVRPAEVGDAVDVPVSVPDASGAVLDWSQRVGGTGRDSLGRIAVDQNDDLWVAGRIDGGSVDVGGTMVDATPATAVLAKYAADGTPQWVRSYPALGSDSWSGWSVVQPDGQGGAFVAGYYANGTLELGGTTHPVPTNEREDAMFARVDANGDVLWSRAYGGDGWDWVAWDISTSDSAGNFLFGGQVQGVVDVFGTQLGIADQLSRILVKVDPDGNLLWAQAILTSERGGHFNVAVGPNDDIVVAGFLQGSTELYGGSTHVTYGLENEGLLGLQDAFTMGVGADGSFQWVQIYGGDLKDGFSAPGFDSSGNLFVTGWTTGALDLGAGMVSFSGSADALVAQLDPTNGDVIWSNTMGGIGTDGAGQLAFDADGNLVFAVAFEGWADFGGGMLVSEGRTDLALMSITPTGEFRWSKPFGGRGAERQPRVVTTADAAYFGFYSTYRMAIDGEVFDGRGSDDFFITKVTLP